MSALLRGSCREPSAAARLPSPEITKLIEAGRLRPETTEREVRAALSLVSVEAVDAPITPAERRRLERKLARLEAEAERIRRRLAG